jgi:hypothetical protein
MGDCNWSSTSATTACLSPRTIRHILRGGNTPSEARASPSPLSRPLGPGSAGNLLPHAD